MINLTVNYQRPPGTVDSHPVEGAYLVEDQVIPNGVNGLTKHHMVVFRQRRSKVMKSKYTVIAAIFFVVVLLLIAGLIAGMYHPGFESDAGSSSSTSSEESWRTSSPIDLSSESTKCGTRPGYATRHRRVIHGERNELGQWPWQVYIVVDGVYKCGGVIVEPEWVFTAAHCLDSMPQSARENYSPASAIRVVAGSLQRGVAEGASRQDRNVSRYLMHPDYSKEWLLHNYDLMLLRLEQPLTMTRHVRPICLESLPIADLFSPGKRCVVAGWGYTARRESPPFDFGLELSSAELPLLQEGECLRYASLISRRQRLQVTPQRLCAGYVNASQILDGRSVPCADDSGSPFVCEDPVTKSWHLVGVVSAGTKCGEVTYFTNVSALSDFWNVIYNVSALPPNEFTCQNGNRSILREWMCDGVADCPDMSDETECECTSRQFQCENRMCILDLYRCDSVDHCGDGSDERNCPAYFNCSDGEQQVAQSTVCDGVFDCSDNSDESNAICEYDNSTHFACDGYIRIPRTWVCDAEEDCKNASDEKGCECISNQFQCDGRCIMNKFVCDNIIDCDDRTDEQNCTCSDEYFFCDSAGLCWEDGMKEYCDLYRDEEERIKDCDPDTDLCHNLYNFCWSTRNTQICERIFYMSTRNHTIGRNGG